MGLTHSPITGGDGNIEFLAHLGWEKEAESIQADISLNEAVEAAHRNFREKKDT